MPYEIFHSFFRRRNLHKHNILQSQNYSENRSLETAAQPCKILALTQYSTHFIIAENTDLEMPMDHVHLLTD